MLIKICKGGLCACALKCFGTQVCPPDWERLPTAGRRRVTPLRSCWIILVLMVALILLWAFWPICYLEVRSLGRPKAPLSLPISSGDRFGIWFLHSYDRAFFQENYEIDSRHQMFLRDMTFKSHLNGGGFAYPHFHLRPDGVGELREINEERNQVEFMMGSKDLANHTLLWRGERIELSNYFEAGEIVTLRVVEKTGLKKVFWFINENGERRP